MAPKKKFPTLGRGLDVLLAANDTEMQGSSSINEISLDKIVPNPEQPRREIDDESLQELANSIKSIGIIQPITLREQKNGEYMIIAGERRWRASQVAGLKTIPAYIKTVSDENVMEMALVENIQREDLNPIEIALAYNNLIVKAHLTQEQVADKVGKKRATVANYLRLLKLPAQIQLALRKGEIDQGHARAIAGLADPAMQVKLFKETQKENYSVHKLEDMVKELNGGGIVKTEKKELKASKDKLAPEYKILQNHLSDYFKQNVQFVRTPKGKGRITIPFNSDQELDQIIALLDNIKK